jgi:hypothetical protein
MLRKVKVFHEILAGRYQNELGSLSPLDKMGFFIESALKILAKG